MGQKIRITYNRDYLQNGQVYTLGGDIYFAGDGTMLDKINFIPKYFNM